MIMLDQTMNPQGFLPQLGAQKRQAAPPAMVSVRNLRAPETEGWVIVQIFDDGTDGGASFIDEMGAKTQWMAEVERAKVAGSGIRSMQLIAPDGTIVAEWPGSKIPSWIWWAGGAVVAIGAFWLVWRSTRKSRGALAGSEDDDRVDIRYGVVRNERTEAQGGGGWLPVIRVNGRTEGSTWATRGYDKEEAMERARERAEQEADHYGGDWTITLKQGLGRARTA